VVRDSIPHTFTVGICEIIFMEREKESHENNTYGGFNPFSVSLILGTLSDQSIGGKIGGISGSC